MTTNKDYTQRVEGIRGRINTYLTGRGISQNQVAGGDSAAQKRINAQLSHGSTLTLDTILRVLDAMPDVSADQLLAGTDSVTEESLYTIHGPAPKITINRDRMAVRIPATPVVTIDNPAILRKLNKVVITHTQTERQRAAIRRLAGGGVDLEKPLRRTAVTTKKKSPKNYGFGGGSILP